MAACPKEPECAAQIPAGRHTDGMSVQTVHLAVYNDLADWEAGFAIAHIRDRQWQRDPGHYAVVTVGAAHYRSELAVTDGDLITASPIAAVEFAREILGKLDVYRPQVLANWYRLFGEKDASAYGDLTTANVD
jgi:hypothetical protein